MLSLHPVTPPQATEIQHPPQDSVPRWKVYLMSAVGSDAYKIIGTDGDGFTKFETVRPCKETYPGERDFEVRNIERKVEILRAEAESRPPRFLPSPRLHLIP